MVNVLTDPPEVDLPSLLINLQVIPLQAAEIALTEEPEYITASVHENTGTCDIVIMTGTCENDG